MVCTAWKVFPGGQGRFPWRKEGRRKEGKGGEGEKEERREEMSQPLS
jgi:hypothetical protein